MIDFGEKVTVLIKGAKTYDVDTMTDKDDTPQKVEIYASVQPANSADTERMRITLSGKKLSGVQMKMYTEEYVPVGSEVHYKCGPMTYVLTVVNISPYIGWDEGIEHYKMDMFGTII